MKKLRRTKQGIILEQLLSGMKNRYVLCWDGDDYERWGGAYDCACCITYVGGDGPDNVIQNCGCNCHWIIEEMATGRYAAMWLLALKASPEMPFIPKNYEDLMQHNRKIKAEHDKWRESGNPSACGSADDPNTCEACKMVLDMEARHKEHLTNPAYFCGKPCHICDEARAAHKPARKKKA